MTYDSFIRIGVYLWQVVVHYLHRYPGKLLILHQLGYDVVQVLLQHDGVARLSADDHAVGFLCGDEVAQAKQFGPL